jgi:hypothetical protein
VAQHEQYCNSEPCSQIPDSYLHLSYEWHPWLFEQTPTGFWENKQNRYHYVKWYSNCHRNCKLYCCVGCVVVVVAPPFGSGLFNSLKHLAHIYLHKSCRIEKQMNMVSPDDWYQITTKQLIKREGKTLLKKV